MDSVFQDLRYAARTLLRSPGFTLVAVLTLALGIGANTAIFGLVNAVLLRPPAHVAEPDRLVMLYTSDFSGPAFGASSIPDIEAFRQETEAFDGVALYRPGMVGVGEGEALERTGIELVSADYFRVLGTPMQRGRAFLDEEGGGDAAPVAVISHGLWQRRFGGDPGIVGRTIRLNRRVVTVVGVTPEGFTGRMPGFVVDVWAPVGLGPWLGLMDADSFTSRTSRGFFAIGRLASGVTLEQASERLGLLARRLHEAYPDAWTDVNEDGRRITLLAESDARVPPMIRGPVLGFMGLLAAVVAIVLLICCANLAGLLLARASRRAREMAIRASLGAGRTRIVRQLLTESLLLAVAGAGVGVLLAVWASGLLTAIELPLPISIEVDLSPDARVLGFTAAITVLAAVAFGLAPALRASRPDLNDTLRSEAGSTTGGRGRLTLRSALVVGQVALSLVLVVGAFLFMRSLREAARLDLGFRAENVLLADAAPPPGAFPGPEGARIADELRRRVESLPGVVAASWANRVPLDGRGARRSVVVEGYQPATGEGMEFHHALVGPGYFETLGVPLVRGRGFTAADRGDAPGVAVVNEAFARRFWPDGDALGRRIDVGGRPFEVVGVTRTGRYNSPVEDPLPFFYLPALQFPGPVTLHVRTSGDPRALAAAVRRELAAVAPEWAITRLRTMDDQIGSALLPQRTAGGALGLFGALALALASLGLYGVIAYAVAQRTREIGIRVALGAARGQIVRMVLRQGMMLVGTGAALGLAAAFGLTRLLESLLLGVGATDPAAFAGATLVLVAVALAAAYIPARRAVRVDPIFALKSE